VGAFPFLRRRFSVKVGALAGTTEKGMTRRFAMDNAGRARRERWLQQSEAAYRRMFEGKSEEELVTLTQRENMAVLIGKELAAFLLEEHVAMDRAAQPVEASTTCCPKCGQPGTPAVQEEGLSERTVTTRVGGIRVRRQRWKCEKCRIVFFPAGREIGLGDGRL
jgi:hypothetical protein